MRHLLLIIIIILNTGHVCPQSMHESDNTVTGRFPAPKGYARRAYPPESFQYYLRNITLKKSGSPVLMYDGRVKRNNVHAAVLDVPILQSNLIQCADAVIKLRAEYLFHHKRYSEIKFTITNGMTVPFSRFVLGYRVAFKGNKTKWKKGGYRTGYAREVFEEYLRFIYAYAGTLSLHREMKHADIHDIETGDVFIQGGSPGHAVMVIDLAEHRRTGKKIMLLAQSYMPSQEIHILKSFSDISPWYYVDDVELVTPEWRFPKNSLKKFEE